MSLYHRRVISVPKTIVIVVLLFTLVQILSGLPEDKDDNDDSTDVSSNFKQNNNYGRKLRRVSASSSPKLVENEDNSPVKYANFILKAGYKNNNIYNFSMYT